MCAKGVPGASWANSSRAAQSELLRNNLGERVIGIGPGSRRRRPFDLPWKEIRRLVRHGLGHLAEASRHADGPDRIGEWGPWGTVIQTPGSSGILVSPSSTVRKQARSAPSLESILPQPSEVAPVPHFLPGRGTENFRRRSFAARMLRWKEVGTGPGVAWLPVDRQHPLVRGQCAVVRLCWGAKKRCRPSGFGDFAAGHATGRGSPVCGPIRGTAILGLKTPPR